MLQIIKNWLAKPSGRYFDGLAIFAQLASPVIRARYLDFFQQMTSEPKMLDVHFTMLINKVADIERNVSINPRAYDNVRLILKQKEIDPHKQSVIDTKVLELDSLRKAVEQLESEKSDVEDENSELQETVDELKSQIELTEDELDRLRSERGITIVKYNDMPDNIQRTYDRNKEITPLMANLHAEISVDKLSNKKRAKLVKELCDLDDERRANWDLIDEWSVGKETEKPLEKEPLAYSDNQLVAGAQMARRILQLKENIKNSTAAYNKAEDELRKQKAMIRIEAYKAELNSLNEILPATENPVE